MSEAAEELQHIMKDDMMRNVSILVFANKMDLPGAMTLKEIVGGLGLNKERRRQWYFSFHFVVVRLDRERSLCFCFRFVQPSIASMGDGLYEGLDWMASALKNKKADLN